MKLLQELLTLNEEPIEVVAASDLWHENKSSVKTYVTNVTYLARRIKDSHPRKFEVYRDVDGKRQLVGKFSSGDFNATYVPIRPNQTEDAEGYKLYRDADEVEAYKHTGDLIKVDLEDGVSKLKKGDYLIRTSSGDSFVYSIERAKFFDTDYVEKI